MQRPFETFETVSESDIAILRIRPQDRIDDGLSKYVVQMRGWPYTSIFGTVIPSGNFKRSLYDQESPFYFKIKAVLNDLGLEETGTPKGEVIEVRRYLIDHTIAIIVPDAYEYTRPKGKDDEAYVYENGIRNETLVKLTNLGPLVEAFSKTGDFNGKALNLYRIEFRANKIANDCIAQGKRLAKSKNYLSISKNKPVYADVVNAFAMLGIKRKDNIQKPLVCREHSNGVSFELSKDEYTYKEGKSKKEKGVEMEDLKKGNYKKLDPETQKLLGETFGAMVAKLRTFEATHPGSATAWEMLGWQDTCINHIRRNLENGSIVDAMNYLMFANHHGWDVSKVLESKPVLIVHNPEDRENRTYEYEFKSVKDSQDYSKLYSVLMDALDQAAYGKGKERHATEKSFEDQPMQTISDLAGSPDGMAYQVIKKVQEALRLPEFSRQKRELLGAIVYAAGMIIWLEKQPTE